jgi:hypothetical protein
MLSLVFCGCLFVDVPLSDRPTPLPRTSGMLPALVLFRYNFCFTSPHDARP